ncbi:MAG TPA: class I SAM-dependent methyltransferase [Hyalangium sp.]|nr:class I SAM-dependent methyltransferase [Hyalangium sp.]
MSPIPRPSRETDPDLLELLPGLLQVPGWLLPEEAALLFSLARSAKGGRIVELGAYQGRSAVVLAGGLRAQGSAEREPLLVVDTFRGSPEHQPGQPFFDEATFDRVNSRVDTFPGFQRNIARFGLEPLVEAWQDTTLQAAQRFRGRIALLFVDADHHYNAVRADLEAWMPFLTPEGVVVLHDVGSWEGPTRAAAELLSSGYRKVDQAGASLALARLL